MKMVSQALVYTKSNVSSVVKALEVVTGREVIARAMGLAGSWVADVRTDSGLFDSVAILHKFSPETADPLIARYDTLLSVQYSSPMFDVLEKVARDLGGVVRKHELEQWQRPEG